ncbi:MAG: RNA methyltransferase, partial [Nitrospirae bacterium]|nr:RNA methyltransferase [Nitrospirota bacterium]
TPQGIIAVVSYESIGLNEISFRDIPFLVVCDGIQDPGNLGTIIRASDAAGADAVIILPGTCDAFMQKTIRATAGSLFNIPIIHAEPQMLFDFIDSRNIEMYAADVHAKTSIYEADFKKPAAVAFGNEAHGVSGKMLKKARGLKIPIIGKAESLNVAMSASICLYEIVRQRSDSHFSA